MEKLLSQQFPKKTSKLRKTMEYYIKENYLNLSRVNIQPRIILIDIYLQLIKWLGERPEYKPFIQPVRWLPDIKIKNPASFLAFCNIHNFFPCINNIYIKDWVNQLDIFEYKEFIFLVRLFHLFFINGYDYVLYDVISHNLKNPKIIEIFKNNKITLPSQTELLSLVKLVEDIKKSTFDIPQNVLNKRLSKLNSNWTYSENIFLEIYMKYENKVRNLLGFENIYMKLASFKQDTQEKTDFILSYLEKNSKKTRFNDIPVQLTISNNSDKIDKVESFLKLNGSINKFLYLQIGNKFKQEMPNLIKKYQRWVNNPFEREKQSPAEFPFFIKTVNPSYIEDAIIMFFCMCLIAKENNPTKINNIIQQIWNINNIDFSKIVLLNEKRKIKRKAKRNTIQKTIWKVKYNNQNTWKIILFEKLR